jgi:hypothetical protein
VTLGEDRNLRVTGDDPQWIDAVRGMRSTLLRQLAPWLGEDAVAGIEVVGGTPPRRGARRSRRP